MENRGALPKPETEGMFHDYIINSRGHRIDIGRAQFLMSRTIVISMPDHRSLQGFWDDYCRRHRERFGEDFPPDLAEEF